MKQGMKNRKWHEIFAPSAQMFRGTGHGIGRGRGPRLAEAPRNERPRRVRAKVAA